MTFLRYLLAYRAFCRVRLINRTDVEENGHFGQPARNNGRLAAWARRI